MSFLLPMPRRLAASPLRWPRACPLALAALALLLLLSCTGGLPEGDPALPPGFADAVLPDAGIAAYVYTAKASPLQIPNAYLAGASDNAGNIVVRSVTAWSGPTVGNFGSGITLPAEADAARLQQALAARGDALLWSARSGATIHLARGNGFWRDAVERSVQTHTLGPLEELNKDAWELMKRLPEHPPVPPLAAGFLDVVNLDLEGMARKGGVDAAGVTPSLGALRVRLAAFGVYADPALAIPDRVDLAFFKEAGLGAVFVAHSGYPSFLLGLLLSSFAGEAGLAAVTIGDDVRAYARQIDGLELLVANSGSSVVFAIAAQRQTAEGLLLSTLSK